MGEQDHEMKWAYLGDGVYAGFDEFGIWLYANDPRKPTDRIYLEPMVLEALNQFSSSFARKLKEEG